MSAVSVSVVIFGALLVFPGIVCPAAASLHPVWRGGGKPVTMR